jgi:hypothetical protein
MSFTFTSHLHEEKKEIKREREKEKLFPIHGAASADHTNLIRRQPHSTYVTYTADAAVEPIKTRIFNYFTTLKRAARTSESSSNRLIKPSLIPPAAPTSAPLLTFISPNIGPYVSSDTGYVGPDTGYVGPDTGYVGPDTGHVRLDNGPRSLNRFTSFTFTSHLHGEKKEIKRGREKEKPFPMPDAAGADYTYLIRRRPHGTYVTYPTSAAVERTGTRIFSYFTTLKRAAQVPVSSTKRLFGPLSIPSLTLIPTPSVTYIGTDTGSYVSPDTGPFTSLLHKEKNEIKSEREKERVIKEKVFPITGPAGTDHTYFIQQRPHPMYRAVEGIRPRIFTYFFTPQNLTSRSLIQSSIQLSTPSFTSSTAFITHLHKPQEGRRAETGDMKKRNWELGKGAEIGEWKLEIGKPGLIPAFINRETPPAAHHRWVFTTIVSPGEVVPIETPLTRTGGESEPLKSQPPLPDMPRFDGERLELRYTSAFYPGGAHRSQMPRPTRKARSLVLPTAKWMSLKTVTEAASIQMPSKSRQQKQAPEMRRIRWEHGHTPHAFTRTAPGDYGVRSTISNSDLKSSAGENYAGAYPARKHFSSDESYFYKERIKNIEQTIALQKKQFEEPMKNAAASSTAPFATGISPDVKRDINLTTLTDNIYNLLMERVKRERRMMGY